MIATKRKSKRRPKPASVDEMIADYAAAGGAKDRDPAGFALRTRAQRKDPAAPLEGPARAVALYRRNQRWHVHGPGRAKDDARFESRGGLRTMGFRSHGELRAVQFELNRCGHVHHWQCSEPEEPGDDQVSIPPARRGPGMFGRGAASATAAERAELRRRNETETVQLGPSAFAAPGALKAWAGMVGDRPSADPPIGDDGVRSGAGEKTGKSSSLGPRHRGGKLDDEGIYPCRIDRIEAGKSADSRLDGVPDQREAGESPRRRR